MLSIEISVSSRSTSNSTALSYSLSLSWLLGTLTWAKRVKTSLDYLNYRIIQFEYPRLIKVFASIIRKNKKKIKKLG